MKFYELSYIFSPQLPLEEVKNQIKEVQGFIQKKEGVIIHEGNVSLKTLAYPIKKNNTGFFGFFEFKINPEHVNELKKELYKNEKILRFIIITRKEVKPEKETKKSKDKTIFQKTAKETISQKEQKEEKIELEDLDEKIEEILGE